MSITANVHGEIDQPPAIDRGGRTTWIRVTEDVAVFAPIGSSAERAAWLRALSDAALKLAAEYEAKAHH